MTEVELDELIIVFTSAELNRRVGGAGTERIRETPEATHTIY